MLKSRISPYDIARFLYTGTLISITIIVALMVESTEYFGAVMWLINIFAFVYNYRDVKTGENDNNNGYINRLKWKDWPIRLLWLFLVVFDLIANVDLFINHNLDMVLVFITIAIILGIFGLYFSCLNWIKPEKRKSFSLNDLLRFAPQA